MKFSYICFLTLFLSACDRFVEKKYLSSDVSDSSIKKIASKIEEEEYVPRGVKKIEHKIIPEEMMQNVSLVLDETLSVKSVLLETAKKLRIDFQIDSTIDSHVIFQASNKPFIKVLDAVCDIADLRYTIKDGFVKVEKDTPYTAIYDVPFLNFLRDSENVISTPTEVSAVLGKEKPAVSSTSVVNVKTKNDFWEEMENDIKAILDGKPNSKYSINKQSGVVCVCANSKDNKQIRDYLQKIKESTTSQVLIEAKIIEVVLKNEYKRGINWSSIGKHLSFNAGEEGGNMFSSSGGGKMTLKGDGGKMSSILNAIEEFGSTRTISNPRITAMNNQAAILKVAQNHVYFRINYTKNTGRRKDEKSDFSVASEIQTVPIGLILFVLPSIDKSNNTITMFLRPTISKLSKTVNDPAVDIAINSLAKDAQKRYEPSQIPITETREIASVLKMNDGEIAVLGGFMEVRSSKHKKGLPLVGNLPILGEAASTYGVGDEIVELVILIRVKIADGEMAPNYPDLRLQRFVPDPRSF